MDRENNKKKKKKKEVGKAVRVTHVPPINWVQNPSIKGVYAGPVTVRSSYRTDSNVHYTVRKYNYTYFDSFYFVLYLVSYSCDYRDHHFGMISVILSVNTNNRADKHSPEEKKNNGK